MSRLVAHVLQIVVVKLLNLGLAHLYTLRQDHDVNIPNLLTLSRIPIMFGILIFLYAPFTGASSVALFLFIIGAITDWADGYFARKQGLISNFGKLMDALADKIFIIGLFTILQVKGVLPIWTLPLLLLIISREFLITGLRLVAASSGVVLAAEKFGKYKTVSQVVAAIMLLLSIIIEKDFPLLLPSSGADLLSTLGVVCFCIATLLTVSSGTHYLIKYWSIFTAQNVGKS